MSYKECTHEQRVIVDAYVGGAVTIDSAIVQAGFDESEGYSIQEAAERLLGSPKIQRAIEERKRVLHDQGAASDLWYLRKLVDYANADYTDVFNMDGTIKPPKHWPVDLRKMVRKIKLCPLTGAVLEVQFEPKTKVLELIGRTDLLGAFSAENDNKETLVIVRDMTKAIEDANEREVIDVEAKLGQLASEAS